MTDKINYLSKLSPYKLWNSLALFSSFQIGKMLRKSIVWGLPDSVAIEPTTACNLRCPECPSGLRQFSRNTGKMSFDLFKKIIDASYKHLSFLTLYFQGEPYINKEFLDFVRYANTNKIYTATSTNAHFLDDDTAKETVKSGLDRLIISLDGVTQDVYEQYRIGGKLNKVVEGTKNVVKWKRELKSSTPHIIFQFLVVKPNEHQISQARDLADELGVDEIKFKTAQIYNYKNGHALMPSIEKYSRYKKDVNGAYTLKNKIGNHCWRMTHSPVITWDGLMVPCCFDKDAKHRMGDASQDEISTIWSGEKYKSFRKRLSNSRNSIDICTNCSEGLKVWDN